MYIDTSSGCKTKSGEFWTFSGEDKGEAGTLRPSINGSMCLDLDAKYMEGELTLVACASDPSSAAYVHKKVISICFNELVSRCPYVPVKCWFGSIDIDRAISVLHIS
jgi:hypothetical protein